VHAPCSDSHPGVASSEDHRRTDRLKLSADIKYRLVGVGEVRPRLNRMDLKGEAGPNDHRTTARFGQKLCELAQEPSGSVSEFRFAACFSSSSSCRTRSG
jgi:hypothetical protein